MYKKTANKFWDMNYQYIEQDFNQLPTYQEESLFNHSKRRNSAQDLDTGKKKIRKKMIHMTKDKENNENNGK